MYNEFGGKRYYYYHGTENFIQNPYRPDVDPVFLELARTVSREGAHFMYGGAEGMNFVKPTSHPRGYFAVLSWIVNHPNSRRSEIFAQFKAKVNTTIARLSASSLIHVNDKHLWSATDIGRSYASAAKAYLKPRALIAA